MHGRDVLMVDFRGGSSLSFETFPRGVILSKLRLHELDGDQTLERPLPSQVYLCHGALAQQTEDLELRV